MCGDPVRRYFKNFDSPRFNVVAVSGEVLHPHYYLYAKNGEPQGYNCVCDDNIEDFKYGGRFSSQRDALYACENGCRAFGAGDRPDVRQHLRGFYEPAAPAASIRRSVKALLQERRFVSVQRGALQDGSLGRSCAPALSPV